MLNCDRCGLYAAGQASICENRYYRENDCESLNEIETKYKKYVIISGYGSKYDSEQIELTGDIRTEEECRERHPWITNIGDQFDNLCDDCITQMLIYKEARPGYNDDLIYPFYTACCDKLVTSYEPGFFYSVTKINVFPYLSYYKIINWDDMDYDYSEVDKDIPRIGICKDSDSLFFSFYHGCTICKDCADSQIDILIIERYDERGDVSKEILDSEGILDIDYLNFHPSHYTLLHLRLLCEIYTDFNSRGKELTKTSCNLSYREIKGYEKRFYMYVSKKNNLFIKRELSIYFAKRNLYILKKYFPISNDIISHILKNF